MIKKNNFIYGTIEECVNEIWKMIQYINGKPRRFPEFDFCADVSRIESFDDDVKAIDIGTGWYGCKQNEDFVTHQILI